MIEEKKKISLHNLYKREKLIKISDNEGNYSELLLIKMTQAQRADTLKQYNNHFLKIKVELEEREAKYHAVADMIKYFKTEDLILAILLFEGARRNEVADLYPNLDGKNEDEKVKMIAEELQKFQDSRKKELLILESDELKEKFVIMTIESQAMLDSLRILNLHSLKNMCVDPITHEYIFKDIEDIEAISEKIVLDKLVDEMNEVRSFESQKEARKTVVDESFFQHGESQKS